MVMKVHLRDVELQGLLLLVAASILVVGVRMSKLPVVTVSIQLLRGGLLLKYFDGRVAVAHVHIEDRVGEAEAEHDADPKGHQRVPAHGSHGLYDVTSESRSV